MDRCWNRLGRSLSGNSMQQPSSMVCKMDSRFMRSASMVDAKEKPHPAQARQGYGLKQWLWLMDGNDYLIRLLPVKL